MQDRSVSLNPNTNPCQKTELLIRVLRFLLRQSSRGGSVAKSNKAHPTPLPEETNIRLSWMRGSAALRSQRVFQGTFQVWRPEPASTPNRACPEKKTSC